MCCLWVVFDNYLIDYCVVLVKGVYVRMNVWEFYLFDYGCGINVNFVVVKIFLYFKIYFVCFLDISGWMKYWVYVICLDKCGWFLYWL